MNSIFKPTGKKGQTMGVGVLATLAITFVIVTITLSLGGDTLDDFQDDLVDAGSNCAIGAAQVNCTTAWNVTNRGLEAEDNVSTRLPLIGTVAGVAVLIGILVAAFRFRS